MSSSTLVRIVLCAVMAYQGYQLGAEYGRELKVWVRALKETPGRPKFP